MLTGDIELEMEKEDEKVNLTAKMSILIKKFRIKSFQGRKTSN